MTDDDPYALLDVERGVDGTTLRRAYEAKLAEASRHGGLRRAQDVDRAYELLRDDSRRALFDRHGVSAPLSRVHPLDRYQAQRAVPFRTWSPAEDQVRPYAAQPTCAGRTGRRAAVVVAVLGAASWGFYAFQAATVEDGPDTSGTIEILCEATASGPAYSYTAPADASLACVNGATARWTTTP